MSHFANMNQRERIAYFNMHQIPLEHARAEFLPHLVRYLAALQACEAFENRRPLAAQIDRALSALDADVAEEVRGVLEYATQPGLLINRTA